LIPGGVSTTPKFWADILLKTALFFILIRASDQLYWRFGIKYQKLNKNYIFQ